jgi:Bacterial Ig domain
MKNSNLLFLFALVIFSLSFVGCKKEALTNELTQKASAAARKPGGGGTVTKPVVSFISPVNGATVTGTIVVKIAASSTAGIKNTSLMQTVGTFNCLAGNDNTSPYEYTWNTGYICLTRVLPGQKVTLRASATDNNGNISFTDIVVTKQ